MAISPTVEQYQQQPQKNTKSVFNKKFSEQAFTLLNSKFTELANNVITFKVVDSDVDKGFGIGAFILRNGKDVLYVPTVMVSGKIQSCEVVYDKKADSLRPLDTKVAKGIVDSKYTTDPKLVGNVRTEDTTQMFKNMFRPPMSSNPLMLGYSNQSMPVTAGTTDLSALPNSCKAAVVKALTDNPHIIQKIAEFYPIDSLVAKLAETIEQVPVKYAEDIFEIVKLDSLTSKTAELLSDVEKADMLKEGFVLKYAEGLDYSTLAGDTLSRLNLTQLGPENRDGTGKLLRLDGTKVVADKFIYVDNRVFVVTSEGLECLTTGFSFVAQDFTTGIKARDLLQIPGATIADEYSSMPSIVFVPMGAGYGYGTRICDNADVSDEDNNVLIGDSVILTDAINKGTVTLNGITFCPKKGSIIVPVKESYKSANVYMQNTAQAYNIFKKLHTTVKLVTDNINWHVKTSGLENVETFSNKADCVNHLVRAYALSKEAVDTLFKDKQIMLLEKRSFDTPQVPVQPPQQNVKAEPQIIEAAANIADPQVLDTGIIASLAGNQDIKLQLVDLLPTFEDTVTRIGKAILLFTTTAEDLEKHYGKEQYTLLLKSLRTVFTTLGDIVADLKKFINFK